MIKMFFDLEFTGLHQNTSLISIGIVSEEVIKNEEGKFVASDAGSCQYFYAELTDWDRTQSNDWLEENVISELLGCPEAPCMTKEQLKEELTKWLSEFDQVQFVGDVNHYDWVLFCNIFGTAFDIPSNVYYMPLDLATLFYANGIDMDINRAEYASSSRVSAHNALSDAIIIRKAYNKCMKIK